MAFTYTGDPGGTPLDAARFALNDTDEATALFQDEEILYLLGEAPSWKHALALLFRQAATLYASQAVKRKLGPQSEEGIERARLFAQLADKYEKDLLYSGTPPLPTYQADFVFEKNMMSSGNE